MKRREKGAVRRIFAGILAAALLTGSVGAQNISAAQHIGETIYQEETDRLRAGKLHRLRSLRSSRKNRLRSVSQKRVL